MFYGHFPFAVSVLVLSRVGCFLESIFLRRAEGKSLVFTALS